MFFKKRHSNLFLTLTDLNKKVVICKTSGSSVVGNSKKKKIAPQATENLVLSLVPFFKLYRLKRARLFIVSRISVHLYLLLRELNIRGIKIIWFHRYIKFPHNGMRGRKVRRI